MDGRLFVSVDSPDAQPQQYGNDQTVDQRFHKVFFDLPVEMPAGQDYGEVDESVQVLPVSAEFPAPVIG